MVVFVWGRLFVASEKEAVLPFPSPPLSLLLLHCRYSTSLYRTFEELSISHISSPYVERNKLQIVIYFGEVLALSSIEVLYHTEL